MLRPTERTGNLAVAGFLFGIGLYSIIASKLMPGGQFDISGPGFFPTLLGFLMCGASVVIGIQAFLQRTSVTRIEFDHRDAWAIIAATLVLAAFFNFVGFIPIVGLFILFLLKLLSRLGWIKCIVLAAAAAVSAYLLFEFLLGISLPLGDWF